MTRRIGPIQEGLGVSVGTGRYGDDVVLMDGLCDRLCSPGEISTRVLRLKAVYCRLCWEIMSAYNR